ncbi:tape measure protein [Sporolactobacillus laevolacticus]|uniref:tape measure protein n=1 Tax=Sporolactobacillus laevolacticus TaxID=33018 RepID=UPI0025B4D3BE|nr:tape measure protein [Sporolactobacillus laevolacticus]MDN3956183.1 tape measure protein [Sporolactobacillus laevolacticus]
MSTIDMATYSYDLFLNDNGFSSKLASAEGRLDSFSLKGNSLGGFLKGSLTAGLIGAGAAVAAMAGSVAAAGVHFDAMKEQSQIAWTTLLGGAKQANTMINNLQVLAAKTPFSFESADKSAKLLKAMGFAAKDIIPDLKILGNATSAVGGDQQALEGVATAIGQMQAKGKVSAEEMNQLAERGIPAWKLMADGMGISVQKLMKLSAQGKVMASQGVPAMLKSMSKAYDGDMQRQSQSFNGLLSTVKDDFTQISGILAQPIFDKMKQGLASVTGMMDNFVKSLRNNGIKETFANMFNFGDLGKGGGMFDGLNNAAKNMFTTLQPILADIGNFCNSVITNIKTFWNQNGQQIMQAFTNIFNAIAAYVNYIMPMIKLTFKTVWDAIKTIFTLALNVIEGAFKIFAGVFTGDWGKVWEGIKQILGGVLNAIKSIISIAWNYISGTTKFIFSGIASVVGSIWNGIKSLIGSVVNGIKSLVVGAWDGIHSITSSIFHGVASIASSIWHGISSTVSGIVHGMSSAISSAWDFIKSATSSAFRAVVGFIKNPLQSINLFSIGKDIINGLVNGIKSMAGSVWNAVKSVAGGIQDKMKSMLGIHSPSTVMASIGGFVTEGLANGITGNGGLIDKATGLLADKISSFNSALSIPQLQYQALPDKSSLSGYGNVTSNNQRYIQTTNNTPQFTFTNCDFSNTTQAQITDAFTEAWNSFKSKGGR